jgi:CHAT domain-containing protein
MSWRSSARAQIAAVAFALTLVSHPGTAAPVEQESPYLIDYGPLTLAQRAARQRKLAAAAAARGDVARQARHEAMACSSETVISSDPRLSSPGCREARRLATTTGLLDVQLTLEALPAELTLRALNPAAAEPTFAGIIDRGAGLDPTAAEARPVRRARLARGVALTELARYDEASAEFERTRAEARRSGDIEILAIAEVWDCWSQQIQGELQRAHAACERARTHLAQSHDLGLDLDLTYVGGLLRAEEGDKEGALADYRRTVELAATPGGELRGPVARTMVASGLIGLGRLDEARAYLEAIDRDVATGHFFRGLVPLLEHQWAKLERVSGHPAEALRHFMASGQSTEHFMTIWSARGQAWARRQQGDLVGARAALEEAIRRLESERVSVAGAAARANVAEVHAAVYRDLVSLRWDAEGAAAAPAALEIAEAGRARALLDALASAQVVGAAAPTLRAAAVQATLAPDEVLVEYVSSEDRLLAVTVTRDRIAFAPLPRAGSEEELGRRVDFFSALAQESDEAALGPAARRLHADILAPALAGVASTARTLIIAADGPLHRLPFDALDDGTKVIERWNVVTLPSASALASRVRRSTPTAAALVVAAPVDSAGLATLPAAPAEGAAIRRRLSGEIVELSGAAATEERLRAALPGRFALLHFASHALLDEARPLRSALVLAPAASGAEGRWSAEEIYGTTLGADLVVLSACGTAAGAETSGEGVMSLARAFLYAGAGATIATLWDVPDAPGPVFADALYRELGAGTPLGAAVAEARRELRRRGAPPRAWAAYTLSGNPHAHVGLTARADPWAAVAPFAGGLALLFLLAAAATRLGRMRWHLSWPVPAMAGVALALIAVALQPWPVRYPRLDRDARSDRGAGRSDLAPKVESGELSWPSVAGADEHVVEIYDNNGLPVGAPTAATSPFALPPAESAGGWARIEARRHGERLSRSALVRVAGVVSAPDRD